MSTPVSRLRVILIERDPRDRAALRILLAQQGNVVVAEAAAFDIGRTLLVRANYDVAFCGVNLVGGSGFDLIRYRHPGARFIFVTRHPEHARRAYDVNASDFLVKPVTPARLSEALRRIAASQLHDLWQVAETTDPAPRAALAAQVPLRLDHATIRNVALAEIILVASCQNYSHVQLRGARYVVRETMKSWEQRLPDDHFVRVHRHVIIGLAHYRAAEVVSSGTSHLKLEGIQAPVPASYRYLPQLRRRLAALGQRL